MTMPSSEYRGPPCSAVAVYTVQLLLMLLRCYSVPPSGIAEPSDTFRVHLGLNSIKIDL